MTSRAVPDKRRSIFLTILTFAVFIVPSLAADPAGQTEDTAVSRFFSRLKALQVNGIRPSFSYTPSFPMEGQPVQFNDTSSGNPTSWQWHFGDGAVSKVKNPRHTYAKSGFFRVTLSVRAGVESGEITRIIGVAPSTSTAHTQSLPKASFSYQPAAPVAGQSVQFNDSSTGDPSDWLWDFNDGTTSTARNPIHTFAAAGSFTVALSVKNSGGADTLTRTVAVLPASSLNASFVYSPSSPSVGQDVQFTDSSTGALTSWSWNFGDGASSSVQSPKHAYASPGSYPVSLTIGSGTGSSTQVQTLTIGQAEVISAASPSLADVGAAIALAKPGDMVMVPAGKATWNGQLVLTKGVKLIGAGAGNTVITSGYTAPTPYDSRGYLIAYLPESPGRDEPFRLSGFTFDLAGKCQWITVQNRTTSAIRQLRIDHNSVSGSSERNIVVRGAVYGVIDSNEMTGGLMLTAYGSNSTSWENFTFDFGTADNIYFEDNTCTISMTPHDGGVGGRYCARFNTYIYVNQEKQLVPWFDMHGNQGPGKNWAGMGVEIYENVLEAGGRTAMIAGIRGGKALVYNNRVHTTTATKAWNRVREEYDDSLNPPAVSPLSGQPQHVSETYFWGNDQNGAPVITTGITETIDYGGEDGIVPRRNVHFWDQNPNFDGTSGLGVGPLAERPANGVAGVGYWATDAKKLYRWSKAGKWEEFYTPYAYPHPLRGQ